MVIRDVVTRWNYTHAMIKRALMLRKVTSWFSSDLDDDIKCIFFIGYRQVRP